MIMRLVRILAALAALALVSLPAHATTFTDGEFVTFDQVEWGGNPSPGNISLVLETEFDSVFAPSGGLLEVGIPGPTGFSLIFDSADATITYLPTNGTPGVLIADLLDPVETSSGAFGGEVVTAALNVTFSDDNLLAHPPGVFFGDLVLKNLESLAGVGPEVAELDGMSVREVLSDANTLLGGGESPFTPQDMFVLLDDIDFSFDGPVSTFAMEHLAFPATAPVPEPSTWAMLLIGFAGLGFVRYRASRTSNAVAHSNRPAQSRG
jgi:PEP-CTERM motif